MGTDRLLAHNLNEILFHLGEGKPVKFQALRSNGYLVTQGKLEIEGYLDVPQTRVVTIEHEWGKELLMRRQLKANRGEFTVGVELLRGHNKITITQEGASVEPFTFPMVFKSTFRDWFESIIKAFVLVVLVKTFVVQAFYIPSGSMEKTLFTNDYILVEKISYLLGEPREEDIIVFQFPLDRTKDYIKRLVAKPGETVQMQHKKFLRNGVAVEEPWAINQDFREYTFGAEAKRDNWGPLTVPKGHVFAMGDNRDNSRDSRFWGPLSMTRLKGRAYAIYYPFSHVGLIRHGVHARAKAASGAAAPEAATKDAGATEGDTKPTG